LPTSEQEAVILRWRRRARLGRAEKFSRSNLRAKAELQHVRNLETVWADLERNLGSRLHEASCDAVLIANALFQMPHPEAAIREARRILKTGGQLLIVEWNPVLGSGGPEAGRRMTQETIERLCQGEHFTIVRGLAAGHSHYGVLFKAS
jgi:ubiquinone/menaquinone biosynthesis C-methylase UbiE